MPRVETVIGERGLTGFSLVELTGERFTLHALKVPWGQRGEGGTGGGVAVPH